MSEFRKCGYDDCNAPVLDTRSYCDDHGFREKVGLAIGEASMLWSETPIGIFESTRAAQLVSEICEDATRQSHDKQVNLAIGLMNAHKAFPYMNNHKDMMLECLEQWIKDGGIAPTEIEEYVKGERDREFGQPNHGH